MPAMHQNPPNRTETITDRQGISERKEGSAKESLRIMQWNACSLKTKIPELTSRLASENIDLLLVQETHLTGADLDDPYIAGYTPYRGNDRTEMKNGGIITYIRDSLKYERQAKNRKNGTEVSTVRIQLSKNKWARITNVYVRPANSEGEVVKLETSLIPTGKNSIICGDFNAHSEVWDPFLKFDDRGEEIENWIQTNDLEVLNDHSGTRFDRHTGKESAPDVTFCGQDFAGKCEWSTSDPIGNSDHLPIIITIQIKVTHQTFLGAVSRWKCNGVDWSAFSSQTDDDFKLMTPLKLKPSVIRFNSTLTNAAKKLVGRTKPGKRSKPWLTATVKAKIKLRNRLRRKINEKRKEWREACKDVNEAINRAKEESWREVLEDAIHENDDSKIWGVVRSLNGSPTSSTRNEAMIHNGKTITSDKKKADIFMQHYANVSRLRFKKRERRVNRDLKKLLRKRRSGARDISCSDFTMYELEQAIHAMRKKGAAGPDDIPPTFLKALGEHGKKELLRIINLSWSNAECPHSWLMATIIPILKAKKPASELPSYRGISLTSCMAKTMERMVANRLSHLAEVNGWLHPSQAGFRKGRSCEDQITRVVQRISDGFNAKRMQRSVLVLLDFSKAYDTVWRERLLLTMAEKGVPIHMIRWLRSFLSNREARVRLNGTLSNCRSMRQGLPQGSVLSPLLFLFYINTLAEILPTRNTNCMFADDVGILATHENREVANTDAQEAVDVVLKWSKIWRLSLNASKSEVAYFTNWSQEADWKPTIMIDGEKIAFTKSPRLLGVHLDRQLTFASHTITVCKSANSSCRILSALSHSTWGWKKEYLVKVFHCLIKSKLGYSAAAWQGNIAECHKKKLDAAQNRGLRLITGQFKDTPLEALRAEARIPSYRTQIDRSLLISKEKALRQDEQHPRRRAFDDSLPKRLKAEKNHNLASKSAGSQTRARSPIK